MPSDTRVPCLFLSHSGADTAAAIELKRRILVSPSAREAGLSVWLDKHDLMPSVVSWQEQIEAAIDEAATCFAVYVGSGGVLNWVEAEVRVALSRARKDKSFAFIPILAEASEGSKVLPPFARQYQTIRDPLKDENALAALVKAAINPRALSPKNVALVERPFVGLKTMKEADAGLFFGRDREIEQLVDIFASRNLAAIVADSGSGKSSLAQAGFVPAFRGGALWRRSSRTPDPRVRHVIVMRPGSDALEGLRLGTTRAAEEIGRTEEQRSFYRSKIDLSNPSETAYQLQCGLPAEGTLTLLVVDQFEEALVGQREDQNKPFGEFLDALSERQDFRVLITIRQDYFNLTQRFERLYSKLIAEGQASVLRLKRISDVGLREIVCRPLGMAGYRPDDPEVEALVSAIRKEMSDRAGDLTLVQATLDAVWRNRNVAGGVMEAYAKVGGVAGALASEAEATRHILSVEEQSCLPGVFVRLIRPGDTAGATRRIALLSEFSVVNRSLVQKLASPETAGRERLAPLLFVGDHVEIAHEALITQWGWLQENLQTVWADLHRLDRLIDRAEAWAAAPAARKTDHLATGAERENYVNLADAHPDWLSDEECAFIDTSQKAFVETEAEKDRRAKERAAQNIRLRYLTRGLAGASLILVAALGLLGILSIGLRRSNASLDSVNAALVQSNTSLAGSNEKLDVARKIAEDRTQEVEKQRRTAEQQSAVLAANFAKKLIDEGSIDQALLLLLNGAVWFRDIPKPDEILIPFYNALERKSISDTQTLPESVTTFPEDGGIYLVTRSSNDVLWLTESVSPSLVWKGRPEDKTIVQLWKTRNADELLLLRDDLTLEIINLKDERSKKVGSFQPPVSITGRKYWVAGLHHFVLTTGGLVIRKAYFDGPGEMHGEYLEMIDVDTGSRFAGESPLGTETHFGSTKDGQNFLFGKNWALPLGPVFKIVRDGTQLLLQKTVLDEARQIELMYAICATYFSSDSGFRAAIEDSRTQGGGVLDQQCSKFGDRLLISTLDRYSDAVEWSDKIAIRGKKNVDDVRELINRNLDTQLSRASRTWVGLGEAKFARHDNTYRDLVGIISNRDIIVGSSEETILNYRHPTPPSTARFVPSQNRILVVEGETGSIVSYDLDPEPGKGKYLPQVDDRALIGTRNPVTPLHFGTCGDATANRTPAKLPDGRMINITDEGLHIKSNQDTFTIDLHPDDFTCFELSDDWQQIVVVNDSDVSIYDFQKILSLRDLTGAKISKLPVTAAKSAFFVGPTGALVVADGTNRVIEWRRQDDRWDSKELYHGEHPVVSAEPDNSADRIIVVESTFGRYVNGSLYSVKARQEWLDLGPGDRKLGATFTSKEEVIVRHGSPPAVYLLPTLSQMVSLAIDALSPACTPKQAGNFRSSPCWPEALQ
jgi:hypothetical protein